MSELHQAVAAGNYNVFEDIIKTERCNLNQKDPDWKNMTPLHWAAAKGNADMVRMLIEHGARPCLRTTFGWSPAHCAAEKGKIGVLRLLHSLSAPIDKEDISGDRPIRIARIYDHKECVDFLTVAETEARERRLAAQLRGGSPDDTDEEWEEHLKAIERRRRGGDRKRKTHMSTCRKKVKL